jgi:hypothetical protein
VGFLNLIPMEPSNCIWLESLSSDYGAMKPLYPIRTVYFNVNKRGDQFIIVCYRKPKILKKNDNTVFIYEDNISDNGEKGIRSNKIKTQEYFSRDSHQYEMRLGSIPLIIL